MAKHVVLIPGFLSSDLLGKPPLGRQAPVWYDRGLLAATAGQFLELAEDGINPGQLAVYGALEPSFMASLSTPFPQLERRLRAKGWVTHFYGYDWRKSIVSESNNLVAFLRDLFADGVPFYVVAHSMGGLLARLAYSTAGAVLRALWAKTVFLGTPHWGSHEAVRALDNAAALSGLTDLIRIPLSFMDTSGIGHFLAAAYFSRLNAVFATWPSAYELLPDVSANWAAQDPVGSPLYYDATKYLENAAVMEKWFTAASTTRTLLNATLMGPRPQEVCVLGTGTLTHSALRDASKPLDLGGNYRTEDGDGVVTVARGTLANSRIIECKGVLHSELPGSNSVLTGIDGWLESNDTATITIPPKGNSFAEQSTPFPGGSTIELITPKFPGQVVRGDP